MDKISLNEKVAKNLRNLIQDNSYTVSRLTKELQDKGFDLSNRYIHNIFNRPTQVNISLDVVVGICDIFNVSLENLLYEGSLIAPQLNEVKNEIFISYSHEDETLFQEVKKFLKPLERKKEIIYWDDTKILPGSKWKDEISKALSRSSTAIFLMSPDFLASDFIMAEEVPTLLKKAENEGTNILWIPLSHCLFTESPLADYQALLNPEKPLDMLDKPNRNKELTRIFTNYFKKL